MDNILDQECTCHIAPPCNYCVETFECEECETRVMAEEQELDGAESLVCDECYEKCEGNTDRLMVSIRNASEGSL